MIPKAIHCFWAQGPKTKLAEKCLASWRRFAPDWEIREWSFDDLLAEAKRRGETLPPFVTGAIAAKKWAFVSDWARFKVLYENGGVYFDLDAELLKSIDELPEGEWVSGEWRANGRVGMNPGGGLALEKGSPVASAMLAYYGKATFGGKKTVGEIMDDLQSEGVDIRVLSPEVTNPIGVDGKVRRTDKTVGIHWYAMSWASPKQKILQWLSWHGFRPAIDALLKVKRALAGRGS